MLTISISDVFAAMFGDSVHHHFWPLFIQIVAFSYFAPKNAPKSPAKKTWPMVPHTDLPPYRPAKINDRKGDLDKSWYIEYYVFSEIENKLVRKRHRIPPEYKTSEARRKYAVKEIREINRLLESGYIIRSETDSQNSLAQTDEVLDLNLISQLRDLIPALRKELRADTIDSYNSAINRLELYSPNLLISNATTNVVYLFRDYLLASGATPQTANNVISHLRSLYTRLSARLNLEINPFKVRFLSVPQSIHANEAFTKEDQKLLEEYLRENDFRLYLFTRFIYYSFLRPKELRMLRISSMNLRDGVILVPGQISKNKKTEQIPIIPPLAQIINEEFLTCTRTDYVFGQFLETCKNPASVNFAYNRHEKALEALNLKHKNYTLYSWKHTGAVNAYLAGVGIKELQGLLRHSSVQITDIYLKSLGLRTDPNIKKYNW